VHPDGLKGVGDAGNRLRRMSTRSRFRHLAISILLQATVLGLAACTGTPDFVVSEMEVRQLSWDSLSVRVAFEESSRLGAPAPVVPDSSWSTVFDAVFDTLYSGSESIIAISDENLADRETILIESCGSSRSRSACEQRSITVSPKAMEVEVNLDFPQNEAYDRGTYRLDYRLKRKVFGRESWEVYPPQAAPGYVFDGLRREPFRRRDPDSRQEDSKSVRSGEIRPLPGFPVPYQIEPDGF